MIQATGKKIKVVAIVILFLIVIAVFLGIGSFLAYRSNVDSYLARIASKLPYPAVIFGKFNFITTNEVNENLKAVRRFYENQDFSNAGLRIDFTTEDGQKRLMLLKKNLLNKLTENKAIEILAKENGITLTPEQTRDSLNKRAIEAGSLDALAENISRFYGWNLDDFERKVARPGLLAQKLEKKIISQNKEEFSREAIERIQAAKNKLGKDNFSEIAKEYSQGYSADSGGEIGWFSKSQLVPEVADIVYVMKKGERSDIIESELGFHIVEVEDYRKGEEGDDMIKLRQIFVRKKTFADWLEGEMKKMKIYVPLADYAWNKNSAQIEFTKNDMKLFEKMMKENNSGDASMIY